MLAAGNESCSELECLQPGAQRFHNECLADDISAYEFMPKMFYSRSNPVFEVRIGLWGGFKSLKDAGSENLLEWSYSISGTGGANLRRAFSINFDPEAEAVRPETVQKIWTNGWASCGGLP